MQLPGSGIELQKVLGHGGMGTVWLGWDPKRNQRVAVKMMLPYLINNQEALARFSREVRILEQLHETTGIRLLESGHYEGLPYAVMDAVEGTNLDEVLLQEGMLPLRTTTRLVNKVLNRLHEIHSAGIVHRDIKPSNIMLSGADDSMQVTLIDFGVASSPSNPWITQAGATVGTPPYMSPEQAFEQGACDYRSDLWGVAVVAYKCLTGRLPFDGPSFAAVCLAIHRGTFVLPSEIRRELDPAIDQWFKRAFARDPKARFDSVLEMAEAWSLLAQQSEPVEGDAALAPRQEQQPRLSFELEATVRVRRCGPPTRRPFALRNWLGAAAVFAVLACDISADADASDAPEASESSQRTCAYRPT